MPVRKIWGQNGLPVRKKGVPVRKKGVPVRKKGVKNGLRHKQSKIQIGAQKNGRLKMQNAAIKQGEGWGKLQQLLGLRRALARPQNAVNCSTL